MTYLQARNQFMKLNPPALEFDQYHEKAISILETLGSYEDFDHWFDRFTPTGKTKIFNQVVEVIRK